MGSALKLADESMLVGVCLRIFNTVAHSNISVCVHINCLKYTNILWNIFSIPVLQ